MRHYLLSILLIVTTLQSCKNVPESALHTVNSNEAISILYDSTQTMVSAHRGGSGLENYPENALETMQYLYDNGIRIFEVDVFQSADNHLMLLHDSHLERTTTGNGKLQGKSSDELLKLNLVDDFGNKTNYHIPFLKDVLQWAVENDVVIMIDFKKSARYENVIKLIQETQAQNNCVLISYNVKQAQKMHRLAPNMLLSVSTRNLEELDWMLESGIATDRMIGFTGTRLSDAKLYQKLNELKIPAILGTLGNLDKRAASRKENMYKKWAELGIQIIATDRPLDANQALKQ